MTTQLHPIVRQMMIIFNRYREIGMKGTYLWTKGKFQIVGMGSFNVKASNDNASTCH